MAGWRLPTPCGHLFAHRSTHGESMTVSSSPDNEPIGTGPIGTGPTGTGPTTRSGRLARRWGNWAANLFVSGVVVMLGVTFGREVVEGWRSGPAESQGGVAASVEQTAELNATSDELWFNELPFAVNRGEAAGTLDEVLTRVVAVCERAAERSWTSRETWERQLGAAERRLLAQLDSATALVHRVTPAGTWTVFERRRPIPLVVAVGEPLPASTGTADAGHADAMRAGTKRADPVERRRVLAWGVVLPDDWGAEMAGGAKTKSAASARSAVDARSPDSALAPASSGAVPEGRWAWFTWRPQAGERPASGGTGPRLPGGRCVLRIASADGSERWAFSGTGSPDAWRAGIEQWFAARGWPAVADATNGSTGGGSTGGGSSTGGGAAGGGSAVRGPTAGGSDFRASSDGGAWRNVGGSRWLGSFQSAPAARRADAQVIQEPSAALRAVLIVYPAASGE